MQYRKVCVAGTFDGLHAGHQELLRAAFSYGDHVVIGLTSDTFVKNIKKTSFEQRKHALETWLMPFVGKYEIFPLDDPIGPAVTADFDALVVTPQNKHVGEKINAMRAHPFDLLVVSLVNAQDKKPISSSRIRNGEIDNTGNLIMPDNLRKELAQPFGPIVTNFYKDGYIITVGDMTTKTFVDNGITPDLAIIDNKVNRKAFDGLHVWKNGKIIRNVQSGPGYISKEAQDAIRETRGIIEVDGEEDLLVLPAIVEAPLGAVLYYGQPNEGIVEVVIDEHIKKQAIAHLAKFTS